MKSITFKQMLQYVDEYGIINSKWGNGDYYLLGELSDDDFQLAKDWCRMKCVGVYFIRRHVTVKGKTARLFAFNNQLDAVNFRLRWS